MAELQEEQIRTALSLTKEARHTFARRIRDANRAERTRRVATQQTDAVISIHLPDDEIAFARMTKPLAFDIDTH
jgi:hypothetical protein